MNSPLCKICRSPQKAQIESDFASGHSYPSLVKKYKFSWYSIRNHLTRHVKQLAELDDLELEINEIGEELVRARSRGDHLTVRSLLLARKDLRLCKQREIEVGDSLQERYDALVADKEFFRFVLDKQIQMLLETTDQRKRMPFDA